MNDSPKKSGDDIAVIDTSDPLFNALEHLPFEKKQELLRRDLARYKERKLKSASSQGEASSTTEPAGLSTAVRGQFDR